MTIVVFATEYDAANVIFSILCRSPSEHLIFPIIVKYKPSNNVSFCLQTQKCKNSKRIDTVFVCHAEKLNLSHYIQTASPIKAEDVANSLNDKETELLYVDMILSQTGKEKEDVEFKYMAYFHKSLIIKYLTGKFLLPTSPFWFLSTYGQTEGLLLLTMYYYLFEEQKSTITTTKNYVQCFTENTGSMVFTYSSMSEFINITLKSKFRKLFADFATYARQKNLRDKEEFKYLDTQINLFRKSSHLTNTFRVHYIYIAYNTALETTKFVNYCNITSYDSNLPIGQQCQRNVHILGNSLHENLLCIMKQYFNADCYFKTYIDIKRLKNPDLNVTEYEYALASKKKTIQALTSEQITRAIAKCNKNGEGLFSPVKPGLQGLLEISASDKYVQIQDKRIYRRQHLHKDYHRPFPVFRVQLLHKNIFCFGNSEDWYENMGFNRILQYLPDEYISDEALTRAIWLQDTHFLCDDFEKQFYTTRHEIFNERIPVTNYIGDLDLPLQDTATITEETFFSMCRLIRLTLINAWKKIFPSIDTNTHPIFFFKTQCDTTNDALDYTEDPTEIKQFCVCRKKIGLRISIPLPNGTAIAGGEPLKQLSKILNHVMCLDQELSQILNSLTFPGECFDIGIYHTGHCIRIGYMYKTDMDKGKMLHGRLTPIFIVPEGYRNSCKTFIQMQMDLNNLLHHGTKKAPIEELIYSITDKGCPKENLSFMDLKSRQLWNKVNIATDTLITKYLNTHGFNNNATSADDSLLSFIRLIGWPIIKTQLITHYETRIAQQFSQVTFLKIDSKNLQIKKTQFGRVSDFSCLNRQHRGNRDNVLVYIQLKADGNRLILILWSTCFATKCQSNSKQVHCSIALEQLKN
uniref:U43 n=1 Tax=Human betaherpesvirus 6 TaxID=10368 RepID=A0A1W6J7U1_9BETA|nr:U43 [Human betaherpesvirus 6]UQK63444.1 helicase/primase complex [Human betaherpesvirus 6B]